MLCCYVHGRDDGGHDDAHDGDRGDDESATSDESVSTRGGERHRQFRDVGEEMRMKDTFCI